MFCYFRTNISKNSGIGNYMRCLRLAQILRDKGHHCKIFTDKKITNFLLNKKIKYQSLYLNRKSFSSEEYDAKIFLQNARISGIVFVDDYRIGIRWQTEIKRKHKKLIIIDDFLKSYKADIVVNTKPNFLDEEINRNILSKYKHTKMLLGPKYAIIEDKVKKRKIKSKKFKIAFYCGGGSDLTIIFQIIKKLIFLDNKNIEFNVILGPHSSNKSKILKLGKLSRQIKIVNPSKNLSKMIKNFDLFIGSAGISIFETALYKVPSIFIKFVKNQEVSISGLEKMGHYFLLEKKDLSKDKKISELIDIFQQKKERIKMMIDKREFDVDDNGKKRIVDEIFKKSKTLNNFNKKKLKYLKKEKKYKIEEVKDKFINEYLNIRNNSVNRLQSINKKIINKIDHYIWWFRSDRQSIIFKKGNEKLMIFFHDIIKIDNKEFLVPGWYTYKKKISFLDLMAGINFQYKLLTKSKKFKNIPQIGIINKNNKSMIELAPKLKWKPLNKKDKIAIEIRKKIKIENKFMIYTR